MNERVKQLYEELKELDAKIQDNLDNANDHPFNKRSLDLYHKQQKEKVLALGEYVYDWLRKQYD